MSSCSWPNFNQWLMTAWGAGQEYWRNCGGYYGATNLVFGVNPPYYLDTFLQTNPKFFGAPSTLANCATGPLPNQITIPSSGVYGLQLGQFITTGGVFPSGTVITGINGTVLTVNTSYLSTSGSFILSVYEAPPMPAFVVQLYINLANASLVQARWQEQWLVAMGWFVAHYCTLYCQTEETNLALAYQTTIHGEVPAGAVPGTVYTLSGQPPGQVLDSFTVNGLYQQPGVNYTLAGAQITTTAPTPSGAVLYATWQLQSPVQTPVTPGSAQIAAQGLATGIQVSKSVGDVSVSYAALESLAEWGQWNLTRYGQQLASMARIIGSGPSVFW